MSKDQDNYATILNEVLKAQQHIQAAIDLMVANERENIGDKGYSFQCNDLDVATDRLLQSVAWIRHVYEGHGFDNQTKDYRDGCLYKIRKALTYTHP